jgi:hypothetical protein
VIYADATYIAWDPFDGDRDVDIRARTVAMVTTRKSHQCHGNEGMHEIPAGTRARYETAIVDGKWGRYYTCVACMDKWLRDCCGIQPDREAGCA